MRILRRFWRLSFSEKLMLGKAWGLLAVVRSSMWIAGFARTKRWVDRRHARVERLVRSRQEPHRIARMVEIASHFFPGGRHCLSRAMVLEALLRRRGYDARLEIGVALADASVQSGSRLSAHAWVTHDDRILLGGAEAPDFKRLTRSGR